MNTFSNPRCDSIEVRNLKAEVNAGYDIWGRQGRQPLHLSTTIRLLDTFESAASQDALDNSTVHYGDLSKFLLRTVEANGHSWQPSTELLFATLDAVAAFVGLPASKRQVEVDLQFPKASRFGSCVGYCASHSYNNSQPLTVSYIERLQLGALIGVNAYERSMKQSVTVSLWIYNAQTFPVSGMHEVEQVAVKTVEESSFATLEALAEILAKRVIYFFVEPSMAMAGAQEKAGAIMQRPEVRIRLEKPSAVRLADTPIIEIHRSASDSKKDRETAGDPERKIPFPLEGRLDEHLRARGWEL